ncbi:Uncharacterised protein [Pannonibacter phragmitetus]|uniref:Lipoprotein n=1 Tax=Pannonibacter phragmitetus TaxID=121719 RepID=A0A378ZW33_9HYPH|nr:hypothetical protein [Pannonibacter phragmitetus]SUB01278.1 Uncharacterised protein [Pannonibacter phragmitetus]
MQTKADYLHISKAGRALQMLLAATVLAGCAAQAELGPEIWYRDRKALLPKADRLYICHGFGCTYKAPVDFSSADRRKLASILASGKESPAAERRAVSRAVQWQEARVTAALGTAPDIGGLDMRNAGVPGQMDCIDEASNTTSLLLYAERAGLLRHHRVASPVARGFLLDGRYPHATAVLRESAGGQAYAIDSWVRANAKPPVVQPLESWFGAAGAW